MPDAGGPIFPAWALRGFRALVLVGIAFALRSMPRTEAVPRGEMPLDLTVVQSVLPGATGAVARADGSFTVNDILGDPIGRVIRTSPAADRIIGFSGPSEVALVFDDADRIVLASLIYSADTRDHASAVEEHGAFWDSIAGNSWAEAAAGLDVDAVSGATLTSLAILEGISVRLGGTPPSLRFPTRIQVAELGRFFPTATDLGDGNGIREVIDGNGAIVGHVFRTSPDGDQIAGYQGPTDTLVALDQHGRIVGLGVRDSFETEEYLEAVRAEPDWDTPLRGVAYEALPELDLEAAEVEGVSGATMTCQAMAESVVVRARALRDARTPPSSEPPIISGAPRDIGTAAIVLIGLWLGFSRRYMPRTRTLFQITIVVGLGLVNGDLVSQAVLAGWARNAIPWQSAIGLVLLVGVALVVPLLSGRQIYCRDLCPHGSLQKLIRRRFRGRFRIKGRAARRAAAAPSLILIAAAALAFLAPAFNLADLEPFDAYILQHAGWASLTIAIVGLIASIWAPMAYCRYGCPTGALLAFLRTPGTRNRVTRRDVIATGCLAASWIAVLVSR